AMTTGSWVGVLLVTRGAEIVEQGDLQVTATPGSMVLWDSERTASAVIPSRVSKVSVFVPRDRFTRIVHRPELMTMRRLEPAQAARLLRTLLAELLDNAPLDPDGGVAAGGATLELVRAACGRALPANREWDGALKLRTALDHIEANLADPRLDPA